MFNMVNVDEQIPKQNIFNIKTSLGLCLPMKKP